MPETLCCVPQCNKRGGHSFPSDKDLRKKWIIAIRRDKWIPGKSSVVCRAHFVDADYISRTYEWSSPLRKRLKKGAVPSVFPGSSTPSPTVLERRERAAKRLCTKQLLFGQNLQSDMISGDNIEIGREVTIDQDSSESADSSTVVLEMEVTNSVSTQTASNPFSIEHFIADDAGVHFYTGLESYEKFMFVLSTLGPAAYELNYYNKKVQCLSVPDQFFLTLIKLRQHKIKFELSRMFCVSESTVTNVFVTWVNFMNVQWREIDLFPSRDLVKYFAPSDFKQKFPTTRIVIVECPVKKPSAPRAQQSTFSTYKNMNTVKSLVGCTPGGLVSYISPSYGGSVSDRQIIERSHIQISCDPGDSIMADKGFNVQDLFPPFNITVNIPTFFKKKNRMSGECVIKDRKIASKRVHIERIIGLGKTYKILTQPMTGLETNLSSEIIFICYMLCNFRSCIVSKMA